MCKAHIFTAYKQAWVELLADLPQWPDMAPPAEFAAIMTR